LKATLVTEDGKPLEGANCMVGKDNPKGFMWEVGPDGKLANPTAKSDNQGRLQFQVDRSFLPPNRKIMLGCSTPEHLDLEPLKSKEGGLVVIEVHPELTVLDLDKIVGKIVVKQR